MLVIVSPVKAQKTPTQIYEDSVAEQAEKDRDEAKKKQEEEKNLALKRIEMLAEQQKIIVEQKDIRATQKNNLEDAKKEKEALGDDATAAEIQVVDKKITDAENAIKAADEAIEAAEKKISAANEGNDDASPFEEKDYGQIASTNSFLASFHIGLQQMPEYDSEGNNEGFTESNIFATLGLDRRWAVNPRGIDPTTGELKEGPMFSPAIHGGVNASFFSANIINCDKDAQDNMDACQGGNISGAKFNDVANVFNGSAYLWWHFLQFSSGNDELGLGGRAGLQSRDSLNNDMNSASQGDSINKYWTLGFRYVYYDHAGKKSPEGKAYLNSLPRFLFEFSPLTRFEDYAGIDGKSGDETRTFVYAMYRPTETRPFYLGLLVNGGKGPDQIAVTISYGLGQQKLIEFFE